MSKASNTPKKRCSIEGCGKPVRARDWCAMHYKRWWVHGDPHVVLRSAIHVVQHGTFNEYRNYGCRCDACKQAASEYQREHQAAPCAGGCGKSVYGRYASRGESPMCRACRAAARTIPLEELHGTTTGYKRRCRCDACRAASAAERRRNRQQNRDRENAYQRRRRWASLTPLQRATSRLAEEMAS